VFEEAMCLGFAARIVEINLAQPYPVAMGTKGKTLVPGFRPCERARKSHIMLAAVSAFNLVFLMPLLLFAMTSMEHRSDGVLILNAFSLLVVASVSVGMILVSASTLRKMPDLMILEDGIEVDRRFVPFSAITRLQIEDSRECLRIHYKWHGAELSCLVPIWMRNGGRFDKEFAALSGLPLSSPSDATHAPSSA
jgi:hypothetical protein